MANLRREEAVTRSLLLSDVRYRVRLDLGRGGDTFGSETFLQFRCNEPGASTFVELLSPSLESARLNGRDLPPDAFDGTRLRLDGLRPWNELAVRAACAYEHTGVGMHRFRDPVDGGTYLYTDLEPYNAYRVYACFDQPDIKATFDVSVVAPEGWQVVSNGAVRGEPRPAGDGLREWRFATTPPISTYITCVAAGTFHAVRERHRDIDLGLFCRRSLAQYLDPDEILEITRQGFDFYEQVFGYPYPFHKYDQLFVPEYNAGAMENAGCVTFNENHIFRSRVTEAMRERRADTILHEMAHMWFGDLVTMSWWDDLWLNESFATFMAYLSMVRATRFTRAWTTFANGWKVWAYRQDQLPTTHPVTADAPDTHSAKVNFDGITYAKGASVLRQLVAWVGEEAFLEGVRRYFRRYQFSNTALTDFLDALEETSGRDLTSWSKEWLEAAGVNTLRPAVGAADGRFRSLALLQEAPEQWPTLRSHRVAVGLYDDEAGRLVRRRRVEVDVSGPRTEVPELTGEKVPALLLVNDDDLAYAKVRLDDVSLATMRSRLGDVADPLARALCWSAAWDMLRDAEMPARDYLAIVLANVEGETEVSVLQNLLGQAEAAVLTFGDPAKREPALHGLAAAALSAFERAAPGSDHQLAWARCFASAARSDEHLAIVRGLLQGSVVFDRLTVDTDLRWHLVRCLATAGAEGEQVIAAELERDPTDAGRRHALAARAARPTPEAKTEAWRAIVDDRALPLAEMRTLMAGFQQPGQSHLLTAFVDPYFDALGPVWEERNLEVALAFAGAMYPHNVIDEVVAARTESFLTARSPAPPCRRALLEGRDGILRALRARARDAAD